MPRTRANRRSTVQAVPAAAAPAPQVASVSPAPVLYAGPGRTCIVYATNGNASDVSRLVWSLRSLVRHATVSFDVVVLSNDPIDNDLIGQSCRGHAYRNITGMYEVLRGVGMFRERWNRPWPFEVLYRLGIPLSPWSSEYSRVLYLDTDTLVLSPKVDRLLVADLSGFEAGAVYDIDGDCYSRIDSLLRTDLLPAQATEVVAHVGPSLFTRAYINAGVLLLNLSEIRARLDWYRRRLGMFWAAECRCQFEYLDQDFVNAMMKVRSDFSTMFNWQRGGYPAGCVIRHYIKTQKADMELKAKECGYYDRPAE